jgi:hypothetical protein
MLIYHILALGSVLIVGLVMMMIYAGKEEYIEIKTDLHNCFSRDLDYTIELMKDLTPSECDRKIDEFENKWNYCINERQLKTAIGKLIDAQMRCSNHIGIGS